ncbi:MAG: RNA polymerase sigma factor SigM [Nocardioides sp.]|nr:RNA polymerase sigma factor SigM [Nocardioides sp.]
MSPPGEPDDRALLAAHVAGDPEAFGILFTRHRGRLWAVALRTLGDPDDAADALQDAMVAAFRRAASYRGDAAVTTWLHRVVVNACLDRVRRETVRRTEPLPEDLDARDRYAVAADSLDADPATTAEAHERRDLLLQALGTLPPEQRAALVLVDIEGHSVEQAAAVLDVAPGTVKSRCSRGRARLATLLGPLLRETPEGGDRPAGNPEPRRAVPSPTAPAGRSPDGGDPRA